MAYPPDIIPAEERARYAKGNYRVVVPIECVADRSATSHQVNLFDMDMKYADVLPVADVRAHFARR
jgi:hypothetical protein